jgi:hypothetical protein
VACCFRKFAHSIIIIMSDYNSDGSDGAGGRTEAKNSASTDDTQEAPQVQVAGAAAPPSTAVAVLGNSANAARAGAVTDGAGAANSTAPDTAPVKALAQTAPGTAPGAAPATAVGAPSNTNDIVKLLQFQAEHARKADAEKRAKAIQTLRNQIRNNSRANAADMLRDLAEYVCEEPNLAKEAVIDTMDSVLYDRMIAMFPGDSNMDAFGGFMDGVKVATAAAGLDWRAPFEPKAFVASWAWAARSFRASETERFSKAQLRLQVNVFMTDANLAHTTAAVKAFAVYNNHYNPQQLNTVAAVYKAMCDVMMTGEEPASPFNGPFVNRKMTRQMLRRVVAGSLPQDVLREGELGDACVLSDEGAALAQELFKLLRPAASSRPVVTAVLPAPSFSSSTASGGRVGGAGGGGAGGAGAFGASGGGGGASGGGAGGGGTTGGINVNWRTGGGRGPGAGDRRPARGQRGGGQGKSSRSNNHNASNGDRAHPPPAGFYPCLACGRQGHRARDSECTAISQQELLNIDWSSNFKRADSIAVCGYLIDAALNWMMVNAPAPEKIAQLVTSALLHVESKGEKLNIIKWQDTRWRSDVKAMVASLLQQQGTANPEALFAQNF